MGRNWLCWLPLASLVAVEIYVGRFDGWGAWAAGPLLLVPAAISLVVAAPLVIRSLSEARSQSRPTRTFLLAVIALLPLLWLGIRRFLV